MLQSAVGNAFRDFDLFAEGTNFRAWIFKYLNLEILGVNRRFQTHRSSPLSDDLVIVQDDGHLQLDESLLETLLDSPDAVLTHCDDVLAAAIDGLPQRERSVLLLKAIGAFKYREIADILSVPMGTVMSSLARARERVRHELIQRGCEREPLQPRASRETEAE